MQEALEGRDRESFKPPCLVADHALLEAVEMGSEVNPGDTMDYYGSY